jgi:uncharacterized membrane protein YkvA (DUF1232 family)
MDKQQNDFYQKIRIQISNYLENHDFQYGDILLLAPDLFHLLVKLSLDKRIPTEKKIKFVGAIAYFISPIDLLPEAFLGPIGYMDDIAIAAYVLNDFINNNGTDIIYEHWAGDSDLLAAIQNVLTVANKYLGQGLWSKLKSTIKGF